MNLYDFIIGKAKGSIDKHVVTKELRLLANAKNKLILEADLLGVSTEVVIEEVDNHRVMLHGDAKLFQKDRDKIYIEPSAIYVQSDELLTFNRFRDFNGHEYYVSDETGMFIDSFSVAVSKLEIDLPPQKTARQTRLDRIREYFDRYRKEHGMTDLTDNEIFKKIGSPTRETIWNDWSRLWPQTFIGFQKNDFSHSPLREIGFKKGTGIRNKKINPLLSNK